MTSQHVLMEEIPILLDVCHDIHTIPNDDKRIYAIGRINDLLENKDIATLISDEIYAILLQSIRDQNVYIQTLSIWSLYTLLKHNILSSEQSHEILNITITFSTNPSDDIRMSSIALLSRLADYNLIPTQNMESILTLLFTHLSDSCKGIQVWSAIGISHISRKHSVDSTMISKCISILLFYQEDIGWKYRAIEGLCCFVECDCLGELEGDVKNAILLAHSKGDAFYSLMSSMKKTELAARKYKAMAKLSDKGRLSAASSPKSSSPASSPIPTSKPLVGSILSSSLSSSASSLSSSTNNNNKVNGLSPSEPKSPLSPVSPIGLETNLSESRGTAETKDTGSNVNSSVSSSTNSSVNTTTNSVVRYTNHNYSNPNHIQSYATNTNVPISWSLNQRPRKNSPIVTSPSLVSTPEKSTTLSSPLITPNNNQVMVMNDQVQNIETLGGNKRSNSVGTVSPGIASLVETFSPKKPPMPTSQSTKTIDSSKNSDSFSTLLNRPIRNIHVSTGTKDNRKSRNLSRESIESTDNLSGVTTGTSTPAQDIDSLSPAVTSRNPSIDLSSSSNSNTNSNAVSVTATATTVTRSPVPNIDTSIVATTTVINNSVGSNSLDVIYSPISSIINPNIASPTANSSVITPNLGSPLGSKIASIISSSTSSQPSSQSSTLAIHNDLFVGATVDQDLSWFKVKLIEKGVCDVAGISFCIKLFRDNYIYNENALGEFKGFTDEFLANECNIMNRGLRSRLLAIHEEARLKVYASAASLPSAEVAKKLLGQVLKEFKGLKDQLADLSGKIDKIESDSNHSSPINSSSSSSSNNSFTQNRLSATTKPNISVTNLSMHVVRVEQLLVALHVYLDKKQTAEIK